MELTRRQLLAGGAGLVGGLVTACAGKLPEQVRLSLDSKLAADIRGVVIVTPDWIRDNLAGNDLAEAGRMNQEFYNYYEKEASGEIKQKIGQVLLHAEDKEKTLWGMVALYDAVKRGKGRLTFEKYLNGLDLEDYELVYGFGKMEDNRKRMRTLPVEDVIKESVRGLIFEPGYADPPPPRSKVDIYHESGKVGCRSPAFKIAINLEGHPKVCDRDPNSLYGPKGHIFWANYNRPIKTVTTHLVPVFYAIKNRIGDGKWFNGDGWYIAGANLYDLAEGKTIIKPKGPFENKKALADSLETQRNSLNDNPNIHFIESDIWTPDSMIEFWNKQLGRKNPPNLDYLFS